MRRSAVRAIRWCLSHCQFHPLLAASAVSTPSTLLPSLRQCCLLLSTASTAHTSCANHASAPLLPTCNTPPPPPSIHSSSRCSSRCPQAVQVLLGRRLPPLDHRAGVSNLSFATNVLLFPISTSRQVCQQIIKPLTARSRGSYCDELSMSAPSMLGASTCFISHTWGYAFADVIDAVLLYFDKQPAGLMFVRKMHVALALLHTSVVASIITFG